MKPLHFLVGLLASLTLPALTHAAAPSRDDALAAMKKAATYYHTKVAGHGGYVYYYSEDLSQRWGEGRATPDMAFVQPPGTPTVGMAFLKAYAATGDHAYLDAAKDAAHCLIHGQLQSGGWDQVIHFAPGAKRIGKYRNGNGGNWNTSSLDDGQTQAALTMLIRCDQATKFQDAKIHDATTYGLNALLRAQFPNGAFPQVFSGPCAAHPVMKASYPDYDWKTEGRVKNYWDHYTLNDGLAGTVAEVLIEAHAVYKEEKYLAALKKLGDFLLLAQMPAPQPAWCQQYNYEMRPIWARKFEPPAVTGWESQDVMRTLVTIARQTGDAKYLQPIPSALAYLKGSLLPDGQVARYYELKTNKPLYMDQAYKLTYDDSAVPQHYGWKQPARLDLIEKAYEAAKADLKPLPSKKGRPTADQVKKIIDAMDKEGRWVSVYNGEHLVGQPKFAEGFRYLSSGVFSENVETVSAFVAEE